MNPKEKALDLVRKFTEVSRGNRFFCDKYGSGIDSAKIFVEEILNSNLLMPKLNRDRLNGEEPKSSQIEYWVKVKEEITKI